MEGGGESVALSKKELRTERKRKKILAEFEITKGNDEMKRPGEFLDAPGVKKLRVEPGNKEKLSPTEFKELKKLLADRKKILQQIPRFMLQGAGTSASLSNDHDVREPIFMSDVQHLLMYALGGNNIIQPPTRWCNIQKTNRLTHAVALVIEGITSRDFYSYEHLFPNLTKHFQDRVEVMAPVYYGTDVAQELSCVPLSNAQKEAILKEYGTLESALSAKEIVKVFRPLFPIEQLVEIENVVSSDSVPVKHPGIPACDTFPRTYLLLGINQMNMEGYPMPWIQINSKYSNFKFSKPQYKEVNNHSPMFAIDCEMCKTTKSAFALSKIAVVNEDLEVVYETFVKPKDQIINYMTRYSGITEESLMNVTTTLEDVQKNLEKILPEDAILIGQSLNCDLQALELMHPYVIDTSVIFNLTGITGRKSKLSHLAEVFLQETIQAGTNGHCPLEDARSAMKLVKVKLANGFLYGDHVAATDDPAVPEKILTSSIFNRAFKSNKTVAVVGPDHVLEKYKNVTITPPVGTAFTPLSVADNKEAISRVTEIATSHQLTMTHLDVSDHLEKASKKGPKGEKKKEKIFTKVDNWCDEVFKHVSINGMCVVVFAGPKNISADNVEQTCDTSNSSSDDINNFSNHNNNNLESPSISHSSSSTSKSKLVSSDQNQPEETPKRKRTKPRRNGVCFVRINAKKV